jgi:hypothetical protein
MLRLVPIGDSRKTLKHLEGMRKGSMFKNLDTFGREGVRVLAGATPVDTGETANSWFYGITETDRGVTIWWNNRNDNNGAKIAILLQYGHGTGTGGYVVGRDYINPAMRPVFDKLADDVWKKVING